MAHHLSSEHAIYAFSKENPPVLSINSGETVKLDTYDCFSNQLKKPKNLIL